VLPSTGAMRKKVQRLLTVPAGIAWPPWENPGPNKIKNIWTLDSLCPGSRAKFVLDESGPAIISRPPGQKPGGGPARPRGRGFRLAAREIFKFPAHFPSPNQTTTSPLRIPHAGLEPDGVPH